MDTTTSRPVEWSLSILSSNDARLDVKNSPFDRGKMQKNDQLQQVAGHFLCNSNYI